MGRPPGGVPPSQPTAPAAAAPLVEQSLFRVRYSGTDGHGRLRLTLRAAGDAFELFAADPFGRALWSFDLSGSETLLLDHRRATYCRFDGEVRIDVVALSELPLRTLPRLLAGRLPFDPAPEVSLPEDGEVDLRDGRGRRWTARFEQGELRGWTLWLEGEPVLWWQGGRDEGILSHRDGAQALWTRTVSEEVPGALAPLAPPPDYAPGECGLGEGPAAGDGG